MSKVAHYLQEHLLGEVLTTATVRKHFSTDASIFSVSPAMVLYPRNESDVRKAARFSWQLAERGRILPITARGLGSNCAGGAIGSGIVMVFPGHMNRVLEFDSKNGSVSVEPGINFGSLQQTLYTHGRFLPAAPRPQHTSTIAGALATNSGGEHAVKYGSLRNFVKSLRIVLANGEVIETHRLNKRELNKKLGLATFEGEIYRSLDKALEEGQTTITKMLRGISKNTAGYDLGNIKHKDGSFDLTPLFIGSEGTLGIITEAELTTELYNPTSTMIVAFLDDIKLADSIMSELRKLPDRPSSTQVIDQKLLDIVQKQNPNQLKGLIDKPVPKLVLIIEFDNLSTRVQKRLIKKVQKILRHDQVNYLIETNEEDKDRLKKISHVISTAISQSEGNARALPVIDDGIVPLERFNDFLEGIYTLCSRYHLQTGVWGSIGDANLHVMPMLDLGEVGDRQKIFRLMDDYYKLVISLGGSTSGEYGDGRLRAPYLKDMYGEEGYALMQKVKQIFDPYGVLNPGVKINVSLDDLKPLLRNSYSLEHLYDHLPQA